MSAQKLMKAACKKINFLNVYCNRLYTKKILFSLSPEPKKIVVKNVQYSIFRQFFTHFYFFLFIQPQLLRHFFYLLVFLLPFVYCCAFILFFPISTLVFLVSIFIHFMSPMFHIFFSAL